MPPIAVPAFAGRLSLRQLEFTKPLANTNYFLTKNSCDKIVIRGGKSEVVGGTGRTRIAVIEFKDYATALECYHSPGTPKRLKSVRAAVL
jgi:uncharacterized protein (DUF1330 family)